MKIDTFIKTVFPTEEAVVVPTKIETKKLEKTWKKVITNLEKDYGPKTKQAKQNIERLKHDEEELDNRKLNIQRQKLQAVGELKQSQEEDKKVLEKIIGKYQGDKLAKEISRLNELPIESLVLVGNKPKKQDVPDVANESVPAEEGVERITPPEDPLSSLTVSGSTTTDYSRLIAGANNSYVQTLSGNWSAISPTATNAHTYREKISDKDAEKLPCLVIFTKPLKTEKPTNDELTHFSGIKKLQIKSWGGKDIGRYIIIINLANMNRGEGLRAFNLDKIVDDQYDHACVSNGSVCLGSRSGTYDKLAKNYQIFDMVDLIFDLLLSVTTARPYSNPYIEWKQWLERVETIKPKFNFERIKRYFNGHDDSRPIGRNEVISEAAAYASVPAPNYGGWAPASAESDIAASSEQRAIIEAEMRSHLQAARDAYDNQRQSYQTLQYQQQAYNNLVSPHGSEGRAREPSVNVSGEADSSGPGVLSSLFHR